MNAAAKRATSTREPALDALRVFGAFVVFVKHSSLATGLQLRSGFHWLNDFEIGPALFFVLSAYLVYLPFTRCFASEERRPLGLRQFLVLRVLRVVPLYWFMLVVLFIIDHQDDTGIGVKFGGKVGLIELLTFTHIYDPERFFNGIPAAYTLDVEMSFYVFVVLFVAALAAVHRRFAATDLRRVIRVERAGIAALFGMNLAWRFAVGHWLRPADAVCSSTETHWTCAATNWLPGFLDYFALGMLLASLVAHGVRERLTAHPQVNAQRFRLGLSAYVVAVLVWLVYSAKYGTIGLDSLTGIDAEMRHQLTFVIAVLLVAPPVLFPPRGPRLARVLESPAVRWAAVLTFGFYLWHSAMLDTMLRILNARPFHANFAIVAPSALVLASALAALTWFLVEAPSERARNLVRRSWQRDPAASGS